MHLFWFLLMRRQLEIVPRQPELNTAITGLCNRMSISLKIGR